MFSFHVFLEGQKELPVIAEETLSKNKQKESLQNPVCLPAKQPVSAHTKEHVSTSAFTIHVIYHTHTHAHTHHFKTPILTHTFRSWLPVHVKNHWQGPWTRHTQQTQGHLRDLHALGFVHRSQVLTDSPRAQWKKADASSRQTDSSTVPGPLGSLCELSEQGRKFCLHASCKCWQHLPSACWWFFC